MSNEQEQIDRERYNAEAEEAYRAEVEEDTPRMAERTDRQAQIDPWAEVEFRHFHDGSICDHIDLCSATHWCDSHQVDAARAADAALLRERDAQIASLTAQVEQQTKEDRERWKNTSTYVEAKLGQEWKDAEAECNSSETRKPVVNLMEALKKSLDSLNANRTSQEPGGHQP